MPATVPTVTDAQLLELEDQVRQGLEERSFGDLQVMGFGELGVAIGLPADAPVAVAKRMPALPTRREMEEWFAYLDRYEALVAEHVAVAPTEKRTVPTDDGSRWAGFMIQPCYDRSVLVEHVLPDIEPTIDHPIVVAIRDAALSAVADGRCAIDAQFTNFVWIDETLISIDCGSPFLYHPDGSPDYEIGAYASSMPSLLRPVVVKMAERVAAQCGTPNGTLELAALSIVRIGQERWLDAVLDTFNAKLDEPIQRADVTARFDKLHGEMQNIKRLGRLQRTWVERVRRRRYDFFITDSFTGEVL
ncbi:MAG: hypothetical protein AAGA99_14105 [Actinomycetota bacterium]